MEQKLGAQNEPQGSLLNASDRAGQSGGERIYPRKPKPGRKKARLLRTGKTFRQRIMEQKKRDTPKMGGSIRPYVTERIRRKAPLFMPVSRCRKLSLGKNSPAKDYGGEIWGAGRQTRSIQRYVTSRTNRRGPGFIPVSRSRTAKDSWSRKRGILRKWEGAYSVCDRTIEVQGSPFYAHEPKPDGKGFMEQKKRDAPKE